MHHSPRRSSTICATPKPRPVYPEIMALTGIWDRAVLVGVAALLSASVPSLHALGLMAPVDVLGNLSTTDFTTYIVPQTYRDWGNEPCVAVNPTNPLQIAISSFGFASWVARTTAQLWYSTNGGASWSIQFAVPTPYPGYQYFVDDQVYAYDAAGVLHGAVMALDGVDDYLWHGVTTNVTSASAWQWDAGPLAGPDIDQPWLAVSSNSVAVAYDNFNIAYTFSEQRVAISTDAGLTFPAALDQAVASPGRVNTGSVNPGLRIAADSLGDFFILCGVRTNNDNSGVPLINYRLNRYSGQTEWDFNAASSDPVGGLALTNGPSRQGNSSAYSFGHINYLLGNITAIAVNTDGSRVFAVYGLSDTNGIGHLYLQTLQTNGATLVYTGPALALSDSRFTAALPSVAVAPTGTVAVLYDQYDGANFQVHFAVSRDAGSSIALDTELYRFTTNGMVFGYGTTASHNRWLGDYGRLITCSNTFFATFAGRGNVSAGSINTTNLIVPFFFSFDASIAPPSILAIARPSGAAARIDFAGSPGVTYFVEATTDLMLPPSWQTVSTNVAPATGLWSYTDSISSTPQRFYRAFTR